MSGDDLRSSVREQRAGKALRDDIRDRHHQRRRGRDWGEMLAQRVQRGKTFRLRVGQRRREAVGRRHSGDQRRRGPQEGKRELGATAIGAASWGEKSGVTPQNQDESRNNEVQGHRCEGDDARGLAPVRKTRAQPTNDAAVGGATLATTWTTISGGHRSEEKIGREQPVALFRTTRATTRPPLAAITVPEFWEACLCRPTRECIQKATSAFPATCARA